MGCSLRCPWPLLDFLSNSLIHPILQPNLQKQKVKCELISILTHLSQEDAEVSPSAIASLQIPSPVQAEIIELHQSLKSFPPSTEFLPLEVFVSRDDAQEKAFDDGSFGSLSLEADDLNDAMLLDSSPKKRTRPDDSSSCLLYTSPSPRDATLSRMPSSA